MSENKEPILEVYDVTKNFGDHEVLRGVNFKVFPKDVICIIGASGSGKTTMLRCLNMLETPTSGSIYFDGEEISRYRADVRSSRKKMGMVFQQFNLFQNKTVLDNCTLGLRKVLKMPKQEAEEKAKYYLEKVGMTPQLLAKPAQLSGGQQQRVALARILASEPRVILLDEPFSALDTFLKWNLELELADLLADFPGPILWVSHDLGECYRNCKTVCVMENGRSGAGTDMQALVLHPATQDAARLAGCRNFLPAHRCAEGVQLDGRALTLPLQAETEQVTIAVPDSAVTLHTGPYSAVVSRVIRDLDASIVLLRPEHQNTPLLRTALPKNAPAEPVQTIRLDLRPEACLCYPSEQARAAAFK